MEIYAPFLIMSVFNRCIEVEYVMQVYQLSWHTVSSTYVRIHQLKHSIYDAEHVYP